jgi:hypothetical protein
MQLYIQYKSGSEGSVVLYYRPDGEAQAAA